MRNVSLSHLVYDFIELYRANHKDTDSLEESQVKQWIHNMRSTILKNRLDKNPFGIDSTWTQQLSDVAVEDVTVGTIKLIKTTLEIPQTINRRGKIGTYTHISSSELFATPYEVISYERALVSNSGIFNTNTKYAFERNGYLYVKNEEVANINNSSILIEGVFQNPEIAAEFAGLTDFDINYDYPIDRSIYEDMKRLILENNFRFSLQQISDNVSDGTDTSVNMKQ